MIGDVCDYVMNRHCKFVMLLMMMMMMMTNIVGKGSFLNANGATLIETTM